MQLEQAESSTRIVHRKNTSGLLSPYVENASYLMLPLSRAWRTLARTGTARHASSPTDRFRGSSTCFSSFPRSWDHYRIDLEVTGSRHTVEANAQPCPRTSATHVDKYPVLPYSTIYISSKVRDRGGLISVVAGNLAYGHLLTPRMDFDIDTAGTFTQV